MTHASAAGSIEVLTPNWPIPSRVRAAMTLRAGGVSAAPYDTLNLGIHVGDDPAAVAENRRRLRESLRLPAEPSWLEQIHSTDVANLDETSAPFAAYDRSTADAARAAAASLAGNADARVARRDDTLPMRRADAAFAHRAGPVCAIQVADCMPVLFAARDGSAVGAAHAGWRGLAGGVLEATLAAFVQPASNLIAWLGPAISQPHFEVGDEVRAAFIAHDPAAEAAFVRNARDRWQCDLYTLARQRLTALGISHISGGNYCTYADKTRFFSYRREGRCGRMAALIWLNPS
jgi:YfiH family protein